MFNTFCIAIVCVALSFANIQLASAQYSEDFRAKIVLEKQYSDIKGSPYVYDEFTAGVVKMATGATYKDMSLKYDQVTGDLLFKDKSGKTMAFADPVSEFMLTDKDDKNRLFRSGYKTPDTNSEKSFYEVLYDGGTILLKDPRKNIVEHRTYNSSTAVKTIQETPVYYIVIGQQPVKVKKDKKALLTALGNSSQLEKYMEANKLNLKEDTELVKLLSYYDSIK